MKEFRILALASLCASASVGVAAAQLPTAAIRGAITDTTGGVLPGVTVSVTQDETGLHRSTVTNELGIYRVAGLPSGHYDVRVELSGFENHTRRIALVLNQEAEVDVTLRIAGTTETVKVIAGAPLVETAKSEMSRTFAAAQIADLPLAGRNYLNLAFLVPGVTTGGTGAQGLGGAVNGQRSRNVNFIVDGSDNNDASLTGARSPIIQDAVGEFRLVTSAFAAEYGRNSGAVAIAATRAGTNAFHGTAYELYENGEKLNARDNLETRRGLKEPGKLRRDTYGFTLGGPAVRNRVFFFGATQRRAFEGQATAVPIPTPTAEGRARLAAIPGADSAMLDLVSKYLPLPNAGNVRNVSVSGRPVPFGDYSATLPNASDDSQTIARADVNVSSRDTLFSRYIYRKSESIGASNPPGFASDSVHPTHNLVSTWNRTFGSALLNELHVSYGRTGGLFPGGSTNPPGNNTLPTLRVSGFFTLGLPFQFPQDRKEQVFQVTDAVSYLRGNHAFKVGADVRRVKLTSFLPFDFRGTYAFQNVTEFIMNRPFSVLKAYGDPEPAFDYFEQAYFAQDDWKLRPNLTVNLGVRYERSGTAQGFYSNVATDSNNVAPRLGFAWDLSATGRTVLRAGYGIVYDQVYLNIPLLAGQAPPFQRRFTDLTGMSFPNAPADRDLSDAEMLVTNVTDLPDDMRTPYAHQWQLGIQRQFGQTWRVEAAYVASRGLNLLRQRVGNPVVCCPQELITTATGGRALRRAGDALRTGQVTIHETSARSSYHSGQFSVEKRFADGLSLTAAYTWSKFIDDASEPLATGTPSLQRPQDNVNLAAEKALSSFDRPHRIAVSALYQVPWMKDQRGVFGRIVGGWQLAGTYALQSGQPFTIITGVDSNGDGDPASDRPNVVPGGNPRSVSGYVLNPLRSGINGNLGRNTGRGPRGNNLDGVLFKNFRVFRQQQLQVRGEVFNLLNHRQFTLLTSGRDRNLSVPTQFYDFRTSNGGSRTVVLGVKYLF